MDRIVSIGMPVYNAQRWINEAIESLLAQSFSDFELIISDNASTDETARICFEYASGDPRVKFFRQDTNTGAASNFNFVFAESGGKYFKWASYDDICAPEYLERCVDVMERDSSVVLSYPKAKCIQEDGSFLFDYENGFDNIGSSKPWARFADILLVNHWAFEVFGLIRRSVLAKTPLIAPFAGSDYTLLAELALHGRFHEVRDRLFSQRRRSDERNFATRRAWAQWFDPNADGKLVMPEVRMLEAYLKAVNRAPVGIDDKLKCLGVICRWVVNDRQGFLSDFEHALKHVTGSRGR